jgi:uncharacterized protein
MATARRGARTRRAAPTRRASAARKPSRATKARKPARSAKARKPSRGSARAAGRSVASRRTSRAPARKAARRSAPRATPKPAPPPPRNLVNWFEIPVQDMARAQAFYERVLQVSLGLHDMGSFQMAWFPGGPHGLGTTGTLMRSEGYTPSHTGSMVYFSVADIDATLARVQANGGRVLNPKMSIGEFGFVAHFEDCEGNRVALHSMA